MTRPLADQAEALCRALYSAHRPQPAWAEDRMAALAHLVASLPADGWSAAWRDLIAAARAWVAATHAGPFRPFGRADLVEAALADGWPQPLPAWAEREVA